MFSIIGAAVFVVILTASLKKSLWDPGCDQVCHPLTKLNVSDWHMYFRENSTDDFDTITRRLLDDWPKASTVKKYHKQAVASDVAVCSTVGKYETMGSFI